MQQFSKSIVGTVLVAALSLAVSLPAHAHITFEEKNDPQTNEENILLNTGLSGSTVVGVTNQSHLNVNFSSLTDTLMEPTSGAARVGASDGTLENLKITVPGGFYTDLIIDPQITDGTDKTPGGTADVSVLTNDGLFTHSYDLGKGDNYLTIFATGGESILSTTLTMEGNGSFAGLKQPRISGAALGTPPPATPEPCTLALLGTGALPLLRLRRRARTV
jgi:hypothetical protein